MALHSLIMHQIIDDAVRRDVAAKAMHRYHRKSIGIWKEHRVRVGGALGIIRMACAQAWGVAKFGMDAARFGVGGLTTLVVAATYVLVLVALVVAVRHAIS